MDTTKTKTTVSETMTATTTLLHVLAWVIVLFVLFVLLTRRKAVLPALPIIAICNFVFLGMAKLLGII